MPQNSQDFSVIFLENISRSIGESIHGDGGRRNRPRPSPQPCKSSADPAGSRTLLQRSRYRAVECKEVISSILRRKVASSLAAEKSKRNQPSASPSNTHPLLQVSCTTILLSSGNAGISRFHNHRARFSLVGFSSPSTSFRQRWSISSSTGTKAALISAKSITQP